MFRISLLTAPRVLVPRFLVPRFLVACCVGFTLVPAALHAQAAPVSPERF